MSIIQAEEISKRFGGDYVFDDVSFQIAMGDRVALIGINGSGKSTLLRVLTGEEELTSGKLTKAGAVQIGYLSQEPDINDDITLFEEVISAKAHVKEIERELREIELKLAEPGDHTELLNRYDDLQQEFLNSGGYELDSEIRKILTGLGFSREDESKPISYLSGGERARVALARLLLEEPDLLLLDEPTNHLDLAAIEWLESYLMKWKTGFILSSHDRYLIDKLAEKTWEIEAGKFKGFPGNYTKFLDLKADQIERQQKTYDEQQELIKKSEEFIRKNFASGEFRENQAKARQKMLDKLERLEEPHREKTFSFRIEPSRKSGTEVLNLADLSVGYRNDGQDVQLFKLKEAHVRTGDRIALIGPNGSGKSSLLKSLLSENEFLSGDVEFGHNVEPAYFRQSHWDEMDGDMSMLDCLMAGKHQKISEAREFLGKFLFSGDDVYKKVGVLSGGQRSRLALARLAQLAGNFLILDEPTNHLDIRSRDVLQHALDSYEGTILFASHDRYLISNLATQIWEIDGQDCRVYNGDYDFYLRKRREYKSENDAVVSTTQKQTRSSSSSMTKASKQEINKLKKNESELAQELEALEEKALELEKEMEQASYDQDHERVVTLNAEYESTKVALEKALTEWEAVCEKLSQLNNENA